jgi:hypothetical protein
MCITLKIQRFQAIAPKNYAPKFRKIFIKKYFFAIVEKALAMKKANVLLAHARAGINI